VHWTSAATLGSWIMPDRDGISSAVIEHGTLDESAHIEATFQVKVEGFESLREQYRRADFLTPSVQIADLKFCLRIWPSGWYGDDDDADAVSVYLYREPENMPIVCGFDLDVRQRCGLSHNLCHHRATVFEGSSGYGADPASFRELEATGFLAGDILCVAVSVNFVKGTNVKQGRTPQSDFATLFRLQDDLAELYDNSTHSDAILVVGSTELQAHRAILSCRSEVFSQMFQTAMEESRSGRVTITDLDADTMHLFLQFLYTGELPQEVLGSLEKLICLLKAADKYMVESLVDECITYIVDMFNPATALRALAAAHEIGHSALKAEALAFSTQSLETLQEVMELPDFDNLSHEVSHELFVRVCRKRTRKEGREFPDGSAWEGMSFAQLQRACDERGVSSVGPKRELVTRLGALQNPPEPDTP